MCSQVLFCKHPLHYYFPVALSPMPGASGVATNIIWVQRRLNWCGEMFSWGLVGYVCAILPSHPITVILIWEWLPGMLLPPTVLDQECPEWQVQRSLSQWPWATVPCPVLGSIWEMAEKGGLKYPNPEVGLGKNYSNHQTFTIRSRRVNYHWCLIKMEVHS